jgi:hypothetical protein
MTAELSCHYVPHQSMQMLLSQALQNGPTRPNRASWACDMSTPNVVYSEGVLSHRCDKQHKKIEILWTLRIAIPKYDDRCA